MAKAGPLADRGHPPVRGTAVEALPVPASEDRAVVALADDQVDGGCRTWGEGDRGGLFPLPVIRRIRWATLDREVFDVGLARFAHPETIQAERHGQRLVGEVVVVGGGQEHTKLRPIEPSSVGGGACGRRMYSAGFGPIRPSM